MVIVVPAAAAPPGILVYQWVDPGGTVRALSANSSVNVEVGERGLGFASVDLAEDKLPFFSGSIVRHAAVQPRMIEVPLLLRASSGASLEGLLDTVTGWFATATEQALTPGYLRVTRQDGTIRQVACYYVSGLEGDLSSERAGEIWQSVVIELKAPDPAGTDTEATTITYLPADLPSTVVMNGGQVEAYPVWTIQGPLTSVVLANLSTEESLTIVNTLAEGDSLTIDTRPAALRLTGSVVDGTGDSQFSKITAGFALWWLQAGANAISITLAGTGGTTEVELSYLQRYRGLLR